MDISKIIQHVITFALTALLMVWLVSTVAYIAKQERGNKILYYGNGMKMTGIISLVFWIALITIMLLTSKHDNFWPLMLFLFFVLMSVVMIIEAYFVRIVYADTSITVSSPWRRDTRIILWDEIESVRFNDTLQWYVCQTRTKGKIRLSLYLSGVGEFLDQLDDKLAARAHGDSLQWPGDKYIK